MKTKIRTKIMANTVLVITVSLIISSYITFSYVTKIVREQAVRDNMTKLAQTSSSLTRMQDRLAKTAETIIVAPEINRPMVPRQETSIEENYFNKVAVMKQLQRLAALDSSLLNIMIIRPDHEVFSNYSGYESYFAEYLKQEWLQPFFEGNNKTPFSTPHVFSFINGDHRVISYVTPYRNFQDNETESRYLLVLDMKLEEIEKVFEDSRQDFERVVLTNGDGDEMYDSFQMTPRGSAEFCSAKPIRCHSDRIFLEE